MARPTRIYREAWMPYAPDQLFRLVEDVAAYPTFVPHCVEGQVLRTEGNTVDARLTFKHLGMTFALTTRNTHRQPDRITMDLLDGPFESLQGCWSFHEVPSQGTHVVLEVTYVFRMQWLGHVFESVLRHVLEDLVSLFCVRARVVLGA